MTAPPPGLLLDIQGTQSRDYVDRGIARYVAELSRALLAVPGLVRGLLLNPTLSFPGHLAPDLACHPLLRWNTATEVRRLLRGAGPVAYHVMSPVELGPPPETVVPPHVLATGIPLVVTLYDLIPLLDPATYLPGPERSRRYRIRLELVRRADLVLTLSRTTRDDAVRLLGVDGSRVAVVGAGVAPFFAPAHAGDADVVARVRAALPAIDREFVLCVGGTDPRKNVERLVRAWGRFPASQRWRLRLVVVCALQDDVERRWREVAASEGVGDSELVLTGRVSDALLRDLYRSARFAVYPATDEGFGLPIAEAAACGCASVVSGRSAVAEVLDDHRATFDPFDPEDIARSIAGTDADPGRLGTLRELAARRAPTWTWEQVARRQVAALDRLAARPPSSLLSRPAPLRVALCGDRAAARDGEVALDAVAAALRGRGCAVTVLGLGHGVPGSGLTVSWLLRSGLASTVDAVVYAPLGSAAEADMLVAAALWPGVVWWRRADQDELAAAAAARPLPRAPGAPWRERAPVPLRPAGTPARAGARPGAAAWLEVARGVVADAATRRRLQLDAGPGGISRRVDEVPAPGDSQAVAAALHEAVAALAA